MTPHPPPHSSAPPPVHFPPPRPRSRASRCATFLVHTLAALLLGYGCGKLMTNPGAGCAGFGGGRGEGVGATGSRDGSFTTPHGDTIVPVILSDGIPVMIPVSPRSTRSTRSTRSAASPGSPSPAPRSTPPAPPHGGAVPHVD